MKEFIFLGFMHISPLAALPILPILAVGTTLFTLSNTWAKCVNIESALNSNKSIFMKAETPTSPGFIMNEASRTDLNVWLYSRIFNNQHTYMSGSQVLSIGLVAATFLGGGLSASKLNRAALAISCLTIAINTSLVYYSKSSFNQLRKIADAKYDATTYIPGLGSFSTEDAADTTFLISTDEDDKKKAFNLFKNCITSGSWLSFALKLHNAIVHRIVS